MSFRICKRFAGFLVGVLPLLLVGCGPAKESEDAAAIRHAVSSLVDAAGSEAKFKDLFASGATVPQDKERLRYKNLTFQLVSEPSVSGDSATAKVRVRDDN